MTTSTQTNTTLFPWEQWVQLPKVEREAEMKEALKENNQVGEYLTDDGSIMLMEAWDGSSPETFQSMWEENEFQLYK